MHLLKIVAIPTVISLLLLGSVEASNSRIRSRVLGKIQKGKSVLAQKEAADDEDCEPVRRPCHVKY